MPGPWRLVYPGVDVTFTNESGIYLRTPPEVADYDIAVDDTDNARTDGTQFGQDFHGGRTIGLSFGIVGATEQKLADRAGLLGAYWDAAGIRGVPGALAELISERGRSAFGRPRKIAPSEVHPEAKMMTFEASFRQADKLWYGPEDYIQVPLAISQSGGLVSRQYAIGENYGVVETSPASGLFATGQLVEASAGSGLYSPGALAPVSGGGGLFTVNGGQLLFDGLKEPLVARGYTTAANTFTVGGESATWPVVTIQGPILNPSVEVPGRFRFTSAASLKYDETLTIDTRPGRQTVLRNGNEIAALTRTSTLLPDASLPPGKYTLILSGSSSTGAPTARATWRSAYSTP